MRLHALVIASALLTMAPDLGAQACCSGSSANEFGVVARGNRALVGARLGQEVVAWSVDSDGELAPLNDSTVLNTTLTVGGGIRVFSPRFQVQGALPFHVQYRRLGEVVDTGFGLGDASLNLRWIALEDDTLGISETGSWLPFVEPHIGMRFPTGRSPAKSKSTVFADLTGRGDFQPNVGVVMSRFITEQDVVFLSGNWGHSLPRTIERSGEELNYRRGEEFNVHLSYFRYQDLFWSLGAFVDYQFVTNAYEEGVKIPRSSSRRLTLGAQVSHFFSWPSWQVRLAIGIDPPVNQVTANLPFGGFSASLSFERHFGTPNEYQ